MTEKIKVQRKISSVSSFKNVVNTKFNQLIPAESKIQEVGITDIGTFFNAYDDLFYQIPPSGSSNSHFTLLSKSSDYLGISFEDMQAEILSLRQENVALKNQLFNLQQATK